MYCLPPALAQWNAVQARFEREERWQASVDDLGTYLNEIESVQEIYTQEFKITGRVLDVGGAQGRLRHYLNEGFVTMFVAVDPSIDAFRDLRSRHNLLRAYPRLREPCNFLACFAEHLPFQHGCFDLVHMRSVLDHLWDPYLAIREAYRVLRHDGSLLVGLTVLGGAGAAMQNRAQPALAARILRKTRREGIKGVVRAALIRLTSNGGRRDHTYQWRYEDVVDLLRRCGFVVAKEHWQGPPYATSVYLLARKRDAERARLQADAALEGLKT
jgi:SAM-dependent methyltransferase